MAKDDKGHGSNGKGAAGGFKYDPAAIRAEAKAARKADTQARRSTGMSKSQMSQAMAKKPEHRSAAEKAAISKVTDAFSKSYGFGSKPAAAEKSSGAKASASPAKKAKSSSAAAETRRIARAESKMR